MKRRRHTPDPVVRKLREADRLLGEGKTLAEVAKALEVPEQTYQPVAARVRRTGNRGCQAAAGAGA